LVKAKFMKNHSFIGNYPFIKRIKPKLKYFQYSKGLL